MTEDASKCLVALYSYSEHRFRAKSRLTSELHSNQQQEPSEQQLEPGLLVGRESLAWRGRR